MTKCGPHLQETGDASRGLEDFRQETHRFAHVPDEMAACLDCGAVQCLNSKYETCPDRLAEVAVLRATRMAEPT